MIASVPVMLLTGPVGVGKSATAVAISDRLTELKVPHALIDLDYLRWCYPRPADDPYHVALGLRNLAAVWANCRVAGADRLILVDILEDRADLSGYQAAVPGAEMCVVRLIASIATIYQRLRDREQGASLAWHETRAVELSELMARRQIGDILLDTDGRELPELAQEALIACNWLDAGMG